MTGIAWALASPPRHTHRKLVAYIKVYGDRLGNCQHPSDRSVGMQRKPLETSDVSRLFGIVGAVSDPSTMPRFHRGALRAFIAAALLCGVALADEGPIKGSTGFFDQFCGECH